MAKFVPSTVIQTPDFLGLAQQRQDQMKKQKAATYNYINDYKQTGENYLEGFIPAVQSQWNQVEQAMNTVAADDNISTRRALDNAYANYAQVAGKAKFLTDGYYENTSQYRADPSAYGIDYNEYEQYSNVYRYTPQTSNSLLAMEEYVVPKSMEFQITAPNEMANTILDQVKPRIETDFYDPRTGKYDVASIADLGRNLLQKTVGYGTENIEMATVYGGLRSMGKDKITNSQQYNFIMSQDDNTKSSYQNDYIDNTMSIFVDQLKRLGDQTRGVSDADLNIKTFTTDLDSIYDPDGKMIMGVAGAKGLTLPKTVETTMEYPTAEKSINDIANDKYGDDYDNLKDSEKAAVDKEHQSQMTSGTVGRTVKVKEKITAVYEKNGSYFVETESKIDDDLSKKITAIKAGVGGALLIQEDGKVMTTTRRATDKEVADILSNRAVEMALQGASANPNDPAGLFSDSQNTNPNDPQGIFAN